ncbi:MAG: hypothetical protein JWN14_1784 [Chthonomonadales bacterium]|nr:hypothetical protein [Chthonomonadales bacterium]
MEKPLCLTEEEAMSLLDLVLVSPADLTPIQRAAFLKLAEHCRQFLREEPDPPSFPVNEANTKQFSGFIS